MSLEPGKLNKILFHIFPVLIDGPYGGGNQFAKALRLCLIQKGHYTDQVDDANVLLFNGYPFSDLEAFARAFIWKRKSSDIKIIITRIDGPIAKIRHNPEADYFDGVLYMFSEMVSDGIVVQSRWSLEQMHKHPLSSHCPMKTIGNAPHPNIFYPRKESKPHAGRLRIIASSWSNNPHKGFDTYAWLDKNIDFTRFEFTIVAATDYLYENIKVIAPVTQEVLSDLLRSSDVYITASRIESCTNASLEALHCGLPVIAPNDSSHPEFMPSADLLFDKKEDIPELLEKLSKDLEKYQKEIIVESIDNIAERYLCFATELSDSSVKLPSKADANRFLNQYNLRANFLNKMILKVKNFIKNAICRK